MRSTWNLNLYRRRRIAPIEYENTNKKKLIKRKIALAVNVIKLISAILVPIMIGVFTIITTLHESKQAEIQRHSDMEKIERQAQLQREMDAFKMKEQQIYEENNLREIRIQNVYDTYIRDMSSIAMKEKKNLTLTEVMFARAKTLATLEQIDSKRKWFLVKFLYDSQLLYANRSGMKYIDLAGADLSNVQFHADEKLSRQLSLENIRLSRIEFRNASFQNLVLKEGLFRWSVMDYSKFLAVSISSANFEETFLENARLILSNLQQTSFRKSHLRFSFWSSSSKAQTNAWNNINYANCDLGGAVFKDITFTTSVDFDQAKFERITFSNVKFSHNKIFKNMNMSQSKFLDVELIDVQFLNCDMFGTIMERVRFVRVTFDHVDLRQSQFNHISYSGTIEFQSSNLIGSNVNGTLNKLYSIRDSLLPNKTFQTTFTKFGLNLIENGDAEQGQCYHSNQSVMSSAPDGWIRRNDVLQMAYNHSHWKMNMADYIDDLGSCFFFGGNLNSEASLNLKNNIIEQDINLEQLSVLFDFEEAKFVASAYLGGFDDELSTTTMRLEFRNKENKSTLNTAVGKVTNDDRQNRTTMLFRFTGGTIPKTTVSVNVQLVFIRRVNDNRLRLGMADNLKLIIQQK